MRVNLKKTLAWTFVSFIALWFLAARGFVENRFKNNLGELNAVSALKENFGSSPVGSSPFLYAKPSTPIVFPVDHGPHPGFQTEWWYWTGHLASSDGARYGFQLTFFRRVESPTATAVWMAHFAMTDLVNKKFSFFQDYAREMRGLGEAQGRPFKVGVGSWKVAEVSPNPWTLKLFAAQDGVELDLELVALTAPVLQGEAGYSRKSNSDQNASHYYSVPRMRASGNIKFGGAESSVSGMVWLDREWSTSALERNQVGWDWMALHGEKEDLMLFRLRDKAGKTTFAHGAQIDPNGRARRLKMADLEVSTKRSWKSPTSNVTYPVAQVWRLPREQLEILVDAQVDQQELDLDFRYWEGSVSAKWGADLGQGYLELTGY